jgi:arginine decarboxylase
MCPHFSGASGSREEGSAVAPGQVVFCVSGPERDNEPNRLLAASIGLALPAETRRMYGYLSEHHSFGETDSKAGSYAEDLAATACLDDLGIDRPRHGWDEQKI